MSKKIVLAAGKEISLLRKHPWIFSGAIAHKDKGVRDGDWITVLSDQGEPLARAIFQEASIAARILSWDTKIPIADIIPANIQQSYELREQLGFIPNRDTNAYRLVHGEGDGLSGLIIDIYDSVAVIQCHTSGMYQRIPEIRDALIHLLGSNLEAIYVKPVNSQKSRNESFVSGFVHGNVANGKTVILENGLRFEVDFRDGQKTGFFLDQRDNRKLVSAYVSNRSVLNTFSYSGGFSVYAIQAGAKEIVSVDLSEKANELCRHNVQLNFDEKPQHQSITANVMEFLRAPKRTFDVVVVDPPAFAKSIKKRHQAVQAYKRLNMLAIDNVSSGGILATYSCSQVVDDLLFQNTITAAAIEKGRAVRILHYCNQPPDHPINMYHKESHYLKGMILRLD